MSRLQAQPRPGNPAHEPILGGNIPTEVPPREPDEFPDQGPTGPRTPYPVNDPGIGEPRPRLRARLSAGRPSNPMPRSTMQQPNQPIGLRPAARAVDAGRALDSARPFAARDPAGPAERGSRDDPDRAPSPGPSTPATPPAAPEPQPRA